MDGVRLQAVQALYHDDLSTRNYDSQLCEAVGTILSTIGANGFLASQRSTRVNLFCPPAFPRAGSDVYAPLVQEISGLVRGLAESDAVAIGDHASDGVRLVRKGSNFREYFSERSGGSILIFCHAKRLGTSRPSLAPASGSATYAALAYRIENVLEKLGWAGDKLGERERTEFSDIFYPRLSSALLPVLLNVFAQREQRFASFPPELAERYWEEARRSGVNDRLRPPWDRPNPVKTATLSLDLRKSTYCMEFARSDSEFGKWLDRLVKKMKEVAHLHGGVFDKFTGDGALIHFLDGECRQIYNKRAVDAAVHCAVDLQRAIEIHMRALRRFLQYDSELFGAGIAIDVRKAFWSFDHRDNPLVVGKGVVGACRVGGGSARQTIRLTNGAYQSLTREVRDNLTKVQRRPLETKEMPGSLGLQCWEFSVEPDLNLGHGPDKIVQLCKEIKQQFDAERIARKRPGPYDCS
jgi:class 3 adenylate cyclase